MIGQESAGLNWVGAVLFVVGGTCTATGGALLAAYLRSDRSEYYRWFRRIAWRLLLPGVIMVVILLSLLPHFTA